MLLLFVLFAPLGVAQRPNDASVCDYYAQARYGSNSSTTQFQLIEGIIALAFGGNNATSNASSSLTGIFNPGVFQHTKVDLQPYFDGSIDSTNLNNQPVGINWLDGGGAEPLYSYLNGSTSSIVLDNSTNQGRLFSHFYAAFGQQFACSNPPPSPPSTTGQSGSIDLAYVHKFMNLNYTDLGHFINQLTLTVQYFGFSDEDAQTLNQSMNSDYNVNCAPPVNGQLQSLCLASSCPLAVPNPDCAAYVNLTAGGVASTAVPSGTSATAAPSAFVPSSVSPSSIPTSATSPTSSSAPAYSSSSPSLAPGEIAGIAIGAAAVVLLAVLIGLLWRYKSRKTRAGAGAGAAPPPARTAQSDNKDMASPLPLGQELPSPYLYQPSTPSVRYASPELPSPPLARGPLYEVDGSEGGREWR